MRWIVGSSTHGCWLGTYELQKQRALERFVRPGMTVYDIGAQAGFYSLFFSRLVGARGRVYAFEPCPDSARFLVEHVRLNKLKNVRIIAQAVGSKTGLCEFTTDHGRTENSLAGHHQSPLLVGTLRLDESSLASPDLIKMDVEGGEAAALKGAQHTLRTHRPVVFVALHGPDQKRDCGRLLREAGYELYSLEGRRLEGSPEADEIYAVTRS